MPLDGVFSANHRDTHHIAVGWSAVVSVVELFSPPTTQIPTAIPNCLAVGWRSLC